MKKMKKVLAVILSLAMVLGMSLTAFAATPSNSDKADLTITGLEKGVTVKLYQIAHAKYGEGAVKGLLKYEWNTGVAFANPDEPTVDEPNIPEESINDQVLNYLLATDEKYNTYKDEIASYLSSEDLTLNTLPGLNINNDIYEVDARLNSLCKEIYLCD